jgi:lipopolysaccharide assembly outer membrane protein LptD (OstA)
MRNSSFIALLFMLSLCISSDLFAQQRLDLDQADILEVIMGAGADTTIAIGNVRFRTQGGIIECDSAIWVRGSAVRLIGRASIDNERYRIDADTIFYDLRGDRATARGRQVTLWAKTDSIYAVGPEVQLENNQRKVTFTQRPFVRLNYPDTSREVRITANKVVYDRERKEADAYGDVIIERADAISHSDRAQMFTRDELVELTGSPVLEQTDSKLSGEKIVLKSVGGALQGINVYDSATAILVQRDVLDSLVADSSRLESQQMFVSFQNGKPSQVRAITQAFVWLNPRPSGENKSEINETSGDSLQMSFSKGGMLKKVTVFSEAIGEYRTSRIQQFVDTLGKDSSGAEIRTNDTVAVLVTDTVRYKGDRIDYVVADSVITLIHGAEVESGGVMLSAHQIEYETSQQRLRAYAASIVDSVTLSSDSLLTAELQPEAIPVRLIDKDQQLAGDYLEYSLESRRGRMVTSKSSYETGYFYGERLYRESEDVFYLDGGRYTTCSAAEPHFHFYSEHLKLKDQKRLVARPVVLYLGRLPLLAIPYWVFPLEKGRRSGILPFTIGNIESGNRFIRNVGYYWAASDYMDLLGALDYYELRRTINFYSKFNYAKRYELSGTVDANLSFETNYDRAVGEERKSTRWTLSGNHSHQMSPTLRLTASGKAQSDRSYYNDFSTNLADRLNRTLNSRANVQWQLSRKVSLTGEVGLDNNLDTEFKSARLPSVSVSLPTFYPFGTGSGKGRNPLSGTTFRWSPSFLHSFTEGKVNFVDTVLDDTSIYVQRKQFLRTDHGFTMSRPTKVLKYLTFNPSMTYTDAEVMVLKTNGSDSAKLEPNRWYRFYNYSMGTTLSSKLYGTMTPPKNSLGIAGIRHVLTPSVGYSYSPKIERFNAVRTYIGGAPGSSSRSQSLSFSLRQDFQARVQSTKEGGLGTSVDSVQKIDTSYRVLDLLTLNSGFSYNLEGAARRLSNLTTTATSSLIRGLTFSGNFTHSFYRPGSNEPKFFSPYLTDYSLDLTTRLNGTRFLFDDTPVAHQEEVDSTGSSHAGAKQSRWGLSLSYSYRENGRQSIRTISSFLRVGLDFLLTPTTSVTYDHYFDVSREKTINNQVQITKGLTDCWTGNIYWIPTGSNAGYGFRIYANALPFLKLDNSQTPLSTGTFFNQR